MNPDLLAALEACASAPTLLVACDYDGTVSPIVDDPEKAVPHAPAVETLTTLAGLTGTHAVLISGRSVDTLKRLSGAGPEIALIGSHGAELPRSKVSAHAGVPELQADLRRVTDRFPGAHFEGKPVGGALHYRHAVDRTGAAEAARQVALAHGAKVVEGKMVVEAMLATSDKGSALRAWQDRVGAGRVIFFGDDTTDEAVFEMLGPHDVGVKVGAGPTAAGHRVADPVEVGHALDWLLRRRQSG